MPLPSDATARSPEDFAKLLATDPPSFIVGGQAVNLWALYYEDRTRDLAPFVSRDADVLGDRATLERLGKVARKKPQFFPLKPPSNEVGVVVAKDSDGAPLLIEVLRNIKGATNEELRETVYEFAIGAEGTRVQVPGPIVLLQAKVANFCEIKQAGRQDARHVLILARVLPAYLDDLSDAVASARMEERVFIGYLEKLLRVLRSKHGWQAFGDLRIDRRDIFSELAPTNLPKLKNFMTKRLPKALG
jgi:hypothetical protein